MTFISSALSYGVKLNTMTAESFGHDREARNAAWEAALEQGVLPEFVHDRLENAASGQGAWVATMTPAELLLARSHGIRPLATVSGTCWFHYGWSWTQGHAQGWHEALERLQREAIAVGANAVVDVRMRTLRHRLANSMDYTLIGTAVRIDRLTPGTDPVVATVPALEFVRLLEADIVPVGVAVGASYDWLNRVGYGGYGVGASFNNTSWQTNWKMQSWSNQPLTELTDFWERIRRDAHADLREAAGRQGNGVLAHTQFGQLLRREQDKQPPAYLGRHIVIGTVVDTHHAAAIPHEIETVIDMRDDISPLNQPGRPRHSGYEAEIQDQEGGI
ncbi:heavy metal-binding domain-containing protein [Porphyrobacter algicida]|uniref:Heavy metal-binding domain-containing protein n=1 Tax=Qipengyuania algicida TaxID=1836209 RepID=A0A845ARE3_9SPHN|nr:heavy metal-binding domain-containing protein [Qipengyuania algicida]MXP29468.1 heavy metal-binding domain-containing protein [Qipengyuania algicida]